MFYEKTNSSQVIQRFIEPIEMTMESFDFFNILSIIGMILASAVYYWIFHIPIDWKRVSFSLNKFIE